MSKCKRCGKEFHHCTAGIPRRGYCEGEDGPYCSTECYDACVPVKTCHQCGEKYSGKTYGWPGYCSEKCLDTAYYELPCGHINTPSLSKKTGYNY